MINLTLEITMKQRLIEAGSNNKNLTVGKDYEMLDVNGCLFFKDDADNTRAADYHTFDHYSGE